MYWAQPKSLSAAKIWPRFAKNRQKICIVFFLNVQVIKNVLTGTKQTKIWFKKGFIVVKFAAGKRQLSQWNFYYYEPLEN